jgi:4-hydroxymandelate oxidase
VATELSPGPDGGTPAAAPDWRLADLESLAAAQVDAPAWAYVQGGAGEERALAANLEAFRRRTLLPRYLVDVSRIEIGTTLLGRAVDAPFFVAPMAYQGRLHPDGERAVARAAQAARVLSVVSTLSTESLEAIAAGAPGGERWFQLYLQPELPGSLALVQRAEEAGYTAIVLTVDVPVLAVRDRQSRSGFVELAEPHGNGPTVVPPMRLAVARGPTFELRADTATTWSVVDALRRATSLPIVVKGILSPEDARRAVRAGARGIIVSNHGGRQLDAAPAALDMLPGVVEAVDGGAEVYVDGGVRRGVDVLIALAMGARAVGLGRPVLWALAVGGEAGVGRLFDLLGTELASAMVLSGVRRVAGIDGRLLGPSRR